MEISRLCIRKDGRMKFWLLLVAFPVIYLLFRLPWIDCDPGIPSIWEYGYNATDEGYYLSGGKEKFVWNHFVDLPRNEAFTYGFSAGTHWLSYASHLAFGLSTWTWRIPFLCVYFAAWLFAFLHLEEGGGDNGIRALHFRVARADGRGIRAYREQRCPNRCSSGHFVCLRRWRKAMADYLRCAAVGGDNPSEAKRMGIASYRGRRGGPGQKSA